MDASPEAIAQHLLDQPSGEGVMGMVVGDETRLRQIITNLARCVHVRGGVARGAV
jgi:hypothetical protein